MVFFFFNNSGWKDNKTVWYKWHVYGGRMIFRLDVEEGPLKMLLHLKLEKDPHIQRSTEEHSRQSRARAKVLGDWKQPPKYKGQVGVQWARGRVGREPIMQDSVSWDQRVDFTLSQMERHWKIWGANALLFEDNLVGVRKIDYRRRGKRRGRA